MEDNDCFIYDMESHIIVLYLDYYENEDFTSSKDFREPSKDFREPSKDFREPSKDFTDSKDSKKYIIIKYNMSSKKTDKLLKYIEKSKKRIPENNEILYLGYKMKHKYLEKIEGKILYTCNCNDFKTLNINLLKLHSDTYHNRSKKLRVLKKNGVIYEKQLLWN
jgi:hypothetical protein